MTPHATVQALGALGVCAAVTVCTLYVTKSTAQNANEGAGRRLRVMPPRSTASQFQPATATGGWSPWAASRQATSNSCAPNLAMT
jgi:hypothetical protein